MCRQGEGFGNPSFNRVWCNLIACTDADTVVSPDWLRYQIQHQPTDAICGTVTLDDFSHLYNETAKIFSTL